LSLSLVEQDTLVHILSLPLSKLASKSALDLCDILLESSILHHYPNLTSALLDVTESCLSLVRASHLDDTTEDPPQQAKAYDETKSIATEPLIEEPS
jgi:hypothetical protein